MTLIFAVLLLKGCVRSLVCVNFRLKSAKTWFWAVIGDLFRKDGYKTGQDRRLLRNQGVRDTLLHLALNGILKHWNLMEMWVFGSLVVRN